MEEFSEGPGKGSEFRVYLPLAEAEKQAAQGSITVVHATTRAASQRILVVDDNQDVADSFAMLLNAMGPQNETAVFLDETRKAELLRAIIEAYYRPQSDRSVVFDTNRAWCARLPLLVTLFPAARVICCVRDVAWVGIEREPGGDHGAGGQLDGDASAIGHAGEGAVARDEEHVGRRQRERPGSLGDRLG